MFTACWSVKGGTGTTVVTASLAICLARSSRAGALVADLAGDVIATLGYEDATGPGVQEWASAGVDIPSAALRDIEVCVTDAVAVLPAAATPHKPALLAEAEGRRLAVSLAYESRPVVADCGLLASPGAVAVAEAADSSLLVIRPCYLTLKRALSAPTQPSGVVLIDEPGRSLRRRDVEEVLGVPVRAEIPFDPAVARAVDAGVLASRMPRILLRSLGEAA